MLFCIMLSGNLSAVREGHLERGNTMKGVCGVANIVAQEAGVAVVNKVGLRGKDPAFGVALL